MATETTHPYTALLVVDNMINRRLIGRLLSHKGLNVVEATSRDEVSRKLNQTPFDIVFVDDVLGSGTGIDIAEDIKSADKETPVIALTTETKDSLPTMKWFDDVLKKPMQEAELSRVLAHFLPLFTPEFSDVMFDEESFETFYQDIKLRREIIELLLDDPVATIPAIEDAFETKDLDVIYTKIHYLKASFNYLKATRLVAIVQHMLDLCKQDELDAVLALQELFLANYRVLRDTLQTYLYTKLSD